LNLNWNKLESIGDAAFSGCSSITGTINLSKDCVLGNNVFTGCGTPLDVNTYGSTEDEEE
jgi:tetrahydrodipicolinate N-succinyltransferase